LSFVHFSLWKCQYTISPLILHEFLHYWEFLEIQSTKNSKTHDDLRDDVKGDVHEVTMEHIIQRMRPPIVRAQMSPCCNAFWAYHQNNFSKGSTHNTYSQVCMYSSCVRYSHDNYTCVISITKPWTMASIYVSCCNFIDQIWNC
jgi:hypothetical protein